MSITKVGWARCLIRVGYNRSLDAWVRFPTWARNFKLFGASFEFCQWGDLHISNTVSWGARALKNFGAPLATKFTYKMRSGGKGMWGRGPALYKHNYYKKKIKKSRVAAEPRSRFRPSI